VYPGLSPFHNGTGNKTEDGDENDDIALEQIPLHLYRGIFLFLSSSHTTGSTNY
jgi:hypothetical protein